VPGTKVAPFAYLMWFLTALRSFFLFLFFSFFFCSFVLLWLVSVLAERYP